MTWEEFLYAYVETGWFDFEDRPKTMQAMRQVWERVPAEVWDEMPSLMIFAPSPWKFGQVFPIGVGFSYRALVYLSPTLESQTHGQVSFTVAHEFAHVALKHYLPDNDDCRLSPEQSGKITKHHEVPAETKADNLAESWGFKRPQEKSA